MQDMATPLVMIENAAGREAFLVWAERALPKGQALVVSKDLVGMRREMRTAPKDKRAVLVAKETPVVLRGGLTSLTSYYIVPADGLDATETHLENGKVSHRYDVLLRVAKLGRKERTSTLVA